MKLCVFQGTFNPIHNAHLRVADYVADKFNFDMILFIPACNPPHKNLEPDFAIHRFNMVKLAIKNNNKFAISDIEYKRGGKSYTYLTICELYKKYNIEGKISFIIGTDAFNGIKNWYEADKLKKLVKFIIFVRDVNFDISSYDYLKEEGYDFEIESLPYKEISSSELREKIRIHSDTSDMITEEVKEYIYQNELYKDK